MTVAIVIVVAGIAIAQTGSEITAQHRQAIKENRTEWREVRQEFKATLTEEQLAILENTELSREEKMEAFKTSLSESQLEMLEQIRNTKEDFKQVRMRHHERMRERKERRLENIDRYRNVGEEKREMIQERRRKSGNG